MYRHLKTFIIMAKLQSVTMNETTSLALKAYGSGREIAYLKTGQPEILENDTSSYYNLQILYK